jgi:tRNA (guanine37-N1)-methyltransferase
MEQEKLEEKVREILGRESFEIENGIASKPEVELELGIYSSEKYSEEDIDHSKDKIFVDEGLDVEDAYTVEEEEEHDLPSFEIIGDIAVINDLSGRDREESVEGILAHHDVKTILLKSEGLSGEFRLGEYEKLYGEETETVHQEYGCKFKVDPNVAFFSEREGTERKRVLDSVEDGENILVMFSGVAPYPVLLAKKKDVEVVGIEKNPEAVKFARKNLEINDVEESVEIIEEDVRNIEDDFPRFDRILMPSPTNAEKFLSKAFELASEKTIITLYTISDNENPFRQIKQKIKQLCRDGEFNVEFLDERIVSDYSPSQVKIAIEFQLF